MTTVAVKQVRCKSFVRPFDKWSLCHSLISQSIKNKFFPNFQKSQRVPELNLWIFFFRESGFVLKRKKKIILNFTFINKKSA